MNLKCLTYTGKNVNNIKSTVKSYIDKLVKFEGATWSGTEITKESIKKKVLELAIPRGATKEQVKILQELQKYAKEKDVELIIHVFK